MITPLAGALSPLGVSAGAAKWYMAGGVTPLAAYQPKGAASLAASYVNLSNPGTYDLTLGSAPTFATATGWTFNGSSQYLKTGIVPTSENYTLIVRCANQTGAGKGLAGSLNSGLTAMLGLFARNNPKYFIANKAATDNNPIAAGTLAVTKNGGYLNGSLEVAITGAVWGGTALELFVGATNYTSIFYGQGDILAAAVYAATLDATQIAAVSAAMAAL